MIIIERSILPIVISLEFKTIYEQYRTNYKKVNVLNHKIPNVSAK